MTGVETAFITLYDFSDVNEREGSEEYFWHSSKTGVQFTSQKRL